MLDKWRIFISILIYITKEYSKFYKLTRNLFSELYNEVVGIVIECRLTLKSNVWENDFGFMYARSSIKAIYIII